MYKRKTTLFDVCAGLLFFVIFLAVLAFAKSITGGKPVKAPPEPQPSILERPV